MKKKIFLIILLCVVFITGCDLANNPNSKVEDLLSRYQKNDDSIDVTYTDMVSDNGLTNELREEYNNIIKKQYEDMSYEIKDTEIDGDSATVTVEIEVKNFKDILSKYDINNYSEEGYHDKIIKDLKNVKEKVTYTIDFDLNKVNDEWEVNDLTQEQSQKLLGIY